MYDYLWVGESVKSGDGLRQATKNYPPYVVPCLDMSRAKIANEDELTCIPFPTCSFRCCWPGDRSPANVRRFQASSIRRKRTVFGPGTVSPSGSTTKPIPMVPTVTVGGIRARAADTRPTYVRWLKQYRPLGGRRHVGVAGGERLEAVCPAVAARRGGFGVCQSQLVYRIGQLRPSPCNDSEQCAICFVGSQGERPNSQLGYSGAFAHHSSASGVLIQHVWKTA